MSSLSKSNQADGEDRLITEGRGLYRKTLAAILEPVHLSEFVAIEPQSGRYFLGNTASSALVAARAAMPNNLFYLTRVGRETAHTVGGHATRIR